MERLNFNVLQQFWTIAKSYWSGDEKWQARGLLLGVVLCLLAYTGLSVVLNNKRGVLISALSAQDEPRFWQTVIVFIAVLVIYAPLLAGYTYLRALFLVGSPAILQLAQIGAIELPMTLDWLNHQQF